MDRVRCVVAGRGDSTVHAHLVPGITGGASGLVDGAMARRPAIVGDGFGAIAGHAATGERTTEDT